MHFRKYIKNCEPTLKINMKVLSLPPKLNYLLRLVPFERKSRAHRGEEIRWQWFFRPYPFWLLTLGKEGEINQHTKLLGLVRIGLSGQIINFYISLCAPSTWHEAGPYRKKETIEYLTDPNWKIEDELDILRPFSSSDQSLSRWYSI